MIRGPADMVAKFFRILYRLEIMDVTGKFIDNHKILEIRYAEPNRDKYWVK